MTSTIRVLVADVHPVVRAGVRSLLSSCPDVAVVGDGPCPVELAGRQEAEVVVAGGPDGATAVVRVRAVLPGGRVLVLSECEDAGAVRRAFEAGAGGYVLKRGTCEQLVPAVRTVAAGGTYVDPAVAAYLLLGAGPDEDRLSEREAQVLRLIAMGYSNKEIAARLLLSVKTVETYKARSAEKLGLRSRADVVRYAINHGWLYGGAFAEPERPVRRG